MNATDTDLFRRAEMRWMSVEDATIEVPARWLAETGRRMADLEALVQAAEAITFAIWEGSPEEIEAADRFRAAVARAKGDTT